MSFMLINHGLPLIALKEQRRGLVISLLNRLGPLPRETIADIAAIQNAIAAIEAVILDIDIDEEIIASASVPEDHEFRPAD